MRYYFDMPSVSQVIILTAKSYFSYEMEYQQAYMEKMRLKVVQMKLPFYNKFHNKLINNYYINMSMCSKDTR